MSKFREAFLSVVLMVVSLLVVFASGELFIRAALYAEWFPSFGLREPWRYADGDLDDDYWKLMFLFDDLQTAKRVGYVDSELGWNTRPTDDDPLGIYAMKPYQVDEFIEPLLFYGDSFVAGEENIPQKLDRLLPGRSVLNFGVGGYGVDQIYLKFSKTIHSFEHPLVLIGILTYDLDRSILGIRGHQKPYFELENDELVLRNMPIQATTQEYIDNNPVEINSYFLRFVLFRMRDFLPEKTFNSLVGYTEEVKRKRTINHAILRAMKDKAEEVGIQPRAVIFYPGEEMTQPTWRGKFLKETLAEFGVEFFDTRSYLLQYIEATETSVHDLYEEDLGHLNQNGQSVVARGLAQWIDTLAPPK